MASLEKKLKTNVAGNFFVDSTCIDCDACRQIAPANFAEVGEYSSVTKQPASEREEQEAWRALLSCPVGSIGYCGKENRAAEFQADFPLLVDDQVYYCGFNSRDSYGANSYLLIHPDGNWMIESPRFVRRLAEKLHAMGGVKYIFLSHRDDVADASKYAAEFGSRRIIHRAELAAQKDSEIVLDGTDSIEFIPGFEIIPTPGHTEGHCVLLYKRKFLFAGDHLYFDRNRNGLWAFEKYCWYDFSVQKDSLAKLLNYEFEWLLPGHGQSVHFSKDRMRQELNLLLGKI